MTHHSNRRTFLRLTGSAIVVGLAGCATGANEDTKQTDTAPSTPTPTQEPQAAEPTTTTDATETPAQAEGEAAGKNEVEMITDNQGTYFDPKGLLIDAGTTVRFVNVSGSHTSTAYHPDNDDKPLRIPEDAKPWDSGIFTEPDKTFEVPFEQPGVYDYYCKPHESMGMVGRIIVDEPKDGPGTSPPDDLPPGAQEDLPPIEEVLENETVPGP